MLTARKGFTLIELLIVVVIIGILAAIAIPKFNNSKEKAYISSMRSDVHNLATAQEAYFSDNAGIYAPDIPSLGTSYKPSPGVVITLSSTANSWIATATSSNTAVSCRLAAGTSQSYDGQVVCQ